MILCSTRCDADAPTHIRPQLAVLLMTASLRLDQPSPETCVSPECGRKWGDNSQSTRENTSPDLLKFIVKLRTSF